MTMKYLLSPDLFEADNSQQSSEVYPDSPKSGAQHQVRFLLLMTLVCLHSLLIIDTQWQHDRRYMYCHRL